MELRPHLPPENVAELLDTISKLMNQVETLRDAVNATLNWYGNDRLLQFPGKQLVEALGVSDTTHDESKTSDA